MKVSNLKKGSILSETSFFVVKEVRADGVKVTDDFGNEVSIGKDYVEKVLNSAELYDKEEKKTMTELAEIFINSPRIAMEVAFYKKDTPKTAKAYNAEKQAKIDEISNAKVADIPKLLGDLIENPISKVVPGDLRVMRGRHYGVMNDLGRIDFKDMEDSAAVMKQVDPRTIQHLIVGGTKYSLK